VAGLISQQAEQSANKAIDGQQNEKEEVGRSVVWLYRAVIVWYDVMYRAISRDNAVERASFRATRSKWLPPSVRVSVRYRDSKYSDDKHMTKPVPWVR